MSTRIIYPGQGIRREELLYEASRGGMHTCPVCGSGLGTNEDCLTCEFAYREMLRQSLYIEV